MLDGVRSSKDLEMVWKIMSIKKSIGVEISIIRRTVVPDFIKHRIWGYLSFKIASNYYKKYELNNLPERIMFETRTKCNNTCEFCAVSLLNNKRDDTFMPTEMFRRVIDELAKLDYKGKVALFNNNEPLMDKRMVSFVQYVTDKLPESESQITTNGILLNPKLANALLEAGLSRLIVNDYDGTVGEWGKSFFDEIKGEYYDRDIQLVIRSKTEVLTNRAGMSYNKHKKVCLKAFCPYAFEDFIITTNGNVGLCCVDAYQQNVIGNVNDNTLPEIWKGSVAEKIKNDLYLGNRYKIVPCNVCDSPGFRSGDAFNPFLTFIKIWIIGSS